jgi:glycoprotein endo-alpha-1,2-mannosidase
MARRGITVNFHIEPYTGRNAETLGNDIRTLIAQYGSHAACYKHKTSDGRELPLLYVYDAYHTPALQWRELLSPQGSISIRNTPDDAVVIALYVDRKDESMLNIGGFDGIYTYFASWGFTEGSNPQQWPVLSALAKTSNAMFIPSVGPGYDDTRVRPWNAVNTKSRENGQYVMTSCSLCKRGWHVIHHHHHHHHHYSSIVLYRDCVDTTNACGKLH